MAVELPDKIQKGNRGAAVLAPRDGNPDGTPQDSDVWIRAEDGKILVNTALGRKKPRNLDANPHVALSWVDPENATACARSRARSSTATPATRPRPTSTRREEVPRRGPYPWRKQGEQRVTYLVEPLDVYDQDP